MASATSFGNSNSGLQAAVINGNVTAQFHNKAFQQWQDNPSSRLLWIRGDPGKGKTMLLCGIIDELAQSLGDTANIIFFFAKLQTDSNLQSTYLIIDALDECTTGLPSLLGLITQTSSAYPQTKWIVSSRNWPDIEEFLNTTQTTLIPLERNEAYVSEAVNKFILHKISHLTMTKNYKVETRDTICCRLLSKSQGTFLWVALVCQELARTSPWNALKKLEAFPAGLDALYRRMVNQIYHSEDAELCKRILGLMSIAYQPVALDELFSLIDIPEYEALKGIVATCGSFLTLRETSIVFVHQSAIEFLLKETRHEIFPKGKEAGHYEIFSRSLQAMHKTLQRDILNIKFPGIAIKEVTQPSPNPLAAVKYACVHWVDHLQNGWSDKVNDVSLDDGGCVDIFMKNEYLHWLEALSILGSLSQGIAAILKLEDLLQTLEGHTGPVLLISWSHDGSRLASASQDKTVKIWDPATGQCTSVFEGHSGSILSISWSHDGSRIASASQDKTVRIWDPATGQCTSVFEGHSGSIPSISWSKDGSRLASASFDQTVRIWDRVTCKCILVLEGHKGGVWSVAWSHDGSRLISASQDKTIRIWATTSNQCLSILKGHSLSVSSIAWSQDGSLIASASQDKTVRIWDPATGQCLSTFAGHCDSINWIAWSPDRRRLASASVDKTVRIWDTVTSQCALILEGHSDSVNTIVWANDGRRLASASWDKTVRIWDHVTGKCISTLKGHGDWVNSIAWSQDGSRLASASFDGTIRIWDPVTREDSDLEGHRKPVHMVVWANDGSRLAAASWDTTVRIWDPATGKCASALEGHSGSVLSIAWSKDGSRLASASYDTTVRIWDPAIGKCVSILQGHGLPVSSIAWSQDESRVASALYDNTMRVWEPVTGQCISTLEGHDLLVNMIAWTQDGSRLASASRDKSVRIWDPATGQCTSTLEGHSDAVLSIAWSQDGSRLASASFDKTVRIWDPATGLCASMLHVNSPHFLQFDEVNLSQLHLATESISYGYLLNIDLPTTLYSLYLQPLWQSDVHQVESYFSHSPSTAPIQCMTSHIFIWGLLAFLPNPNLSRH
ncbi:hypothetical protein N7481_007200 [Penicillium waksmanii]|uniref:uncharacterized protein n=1 Tax=Penicillium waksmanii TaxID=69791 RepID=UPI0025476AFE|nr:uncharacterized protein N7481_007200 [Penicillium waksmanii]KAJ5979902.1 hypothetical protein N7481_007200 [Penicillium waksmanii]